MARRTAKLRAVEPEDHDLDPIVGAIRDQPELDDLRRTVDEANGQYRTALKRTVQRGVSPTALSIFHRLKRMPSAKSTDTWRDLRALVEESGLSEQMELFERERADLVDAEPAV